MFWQRQCLLLGSVYGWFCGYVMYMKRMTTWAHKVVLESHFSEVAQSYMKTTRFSFEGPWDWDWQVWYIQSPLTMQCCSPCSTWTREGHQVSFIILHGQRIDSRRAAICMCDTIRERLDRYISQSSLAWTPCLCYFPISNYFPWNKPLLKLLSI